MYGRRKFCAGISEPWLQERFADEIWAFDMFQEKNERTGSAVSLLNRKVSFGIL